MYETTNGGATWSVWGTLGQAYSMWIEPGGTQAMVGSKYGSLEYTSNYTAANPTFTATAFPFDNVMSMVSDPNNPDKVWMVTYGDGAWNTTLTSSVPAIPTPPTATPDSGDYGVVLNWTDTNSGSGTDYNIQRSTTGTGGWSTVATGVTNTTWTDNAANDPSNAPVGNTTYYYQVQAYYTSNPSNTSGWSSNSNVALTIPAAPTNLADTPGTSTIALTWVDPTSTANITGYRIWRSTDNLNWGSVYATVTGSSATGFTDTAPGSAGTAYYYEVAAYDGTGNSTADDVPCPVATVVAYDGMNYTGTWAGQNGGLGWSTDGGTDAWSTSGTVGLNATGLTYSPDSGAHNLQTAPGSAWVLYTGTATRTFSDPTYGQNGQTRWYSFLMQPNLSGGSSNLGGYVQFNELKLGLPQTGSPYSYYGLRTTLGGTTYNEATSTAASQGTTALVVAEVIFGSTDTVNLWVDPTSFTNLGTPSKSWPVPAGKNFTPATSVTVTVANNNQYSEPTVDEIRYGLTSTAVLPDPLANDNIGTATAPKSESDSSASPRRHLSGSTPFLAAPAQANGGTSAPDLAVLAATVNYRFSPNAVGMQPSANGLAMDWTDEPILGSNASQGNSWLGVFNN
jgi:hypothetical protein